MITPLTICSGADGLKTYNRKDNRHQQMPFTLKKICFNHVFFYHPDFNRRLWNFTKSVASKMRVAGCHRR
jgi:hypothetical protein